MRQSREMFWIGIAEDPNRKQRRIGEYIVLIYTLLWLFSCCSLPFFLPNPRVMTGHQKIEIILGAILAALVPPIIFCLSIRRRSPAIARGARRATSFVAFCLTFIVLQAIFLHAIGLK